MRILLIVQPERFDFYRYLSDATNVEWVLLWYEKSGQMQLPADELPLAFSKIFHWTDFKTPQDLLQRIEPDRIVFFEIIDLRQIALLVTASRLSIPTFYLEHGAAGDKETAITRWKEITFNQHKLPYLARRFKNDLVDVLRSKYFYYSVRSGFRSFGSYLKYLLLPLRMLRAAPNKVLSHHLFPERVPSRAIVFNEVNLGEFALYTGIGAEKALLTGVPFFDPYYRPEVGTGDYMVYIDHPYLEENLLEWTPEHHWKVARVLFDFAATHQVKLYVKLHPRSRKALWDQYQKDDRFVTIIQQGDFMDLYLGAGLILGFSSSLITGFLCARKNVVLLGWHPEPKIFGADFSETGLCHVSFDPEDLPRKYAFWKAHNLTKEKEEQYEAFLRRFNYPFDGRATERVIKAITEDEVS